MNSHLNQNNMFGKQGRDEARSAVPAWLVESLDLLDIDASKASEWEKPSQKNFVKRIKTEVRTQESNRLHNTLPGGLAKHLKSELPGSVPGGTEKYFQSFLPRIRERIQESEVPSKVSPILSRTLDRFRKNTEENIPQDYFSDFLGNVHERIDQTEEIPKWLDRSLKSPSAFGSANETFFDRQRESIDSRVYRPVAVLRLVKNNRFRVGAVAATAACLALVFTFLPSFQAPQTETMSLNRLHQIHGVESIETVVGVQDDILGSDYSIQLIREQLEDEQSTNIDLEILEPPAVLNVTEPEEVVVQ